MMYHFDIARLPRIIFGSGTMQQIPELVSQYGKQLLLVTGGQSFRASSHWESLQQKLTDKAITVNHVYVSSEPSPQFIDNTVEQYFDYQIDVVLGIGGGSALDAAKAIAGLLRVNRSVMDYLEGVGPELRTRG